MGLLMGAEARRYQGALPAASLGVKFIFILAFICTVSWGSGACEFAAQLNKCDRRAPVLTIGGDTVRLPPALSAPAPAISKTP